MWYVRVCSRSARASRKSRSSGPSPGRLVAVPPSTRRSEYDSTRRRCRRIGDQRLNCFEADRSRNESAARSRVAAGEAFRGAPAAAFFHSTVCGSRTRRLRTTAGWCQLISPADDRCPPAPLLGTDRGWWPARPGRGGMERLRCTSNGHSSTRWATRRCRRCRDRCTGRTHARAERSILAAERANSVRNKTLSKRRQQRLRRRCTSSATARPLWRWRRSRSPSPSPARSPRHL